MINGQAPLRSGYLTFRYPVDTGYPEIEHRPHRLDRLIRLIVCRKRTEQHICWYDTLIQIGLDLVWPILMDTFTRCPACFKRNCRKHQD